MAYDYKKYILNDRMKNVQMIINRVLFRSIISRTTKIHIPCVCDCDLNVEERKVKEQEWNAIGLQIKEIEEGLEMIERKKAGKEEEYGMNNKQKVMSSNHFTILPASSG